MSVTDYAARASDHDALEDKARQWIADSLDDRKLVEPDWHEAMYFAAGRHWYQWSRTERRMVMPNGLLAQQSELYTADRINEYRMTALGEMTTDDDRPELLLVRDDQYSEDYQKSVNRAVRHAWEHEWDAEAALADLYRYLLDMGTAGMWCCWDPNAGPVVQENMPHHQGKPVYDVATAAQLMDSGETLTFKDQREGRTVWRPLSAFQMLPPPGIQHEREFPYDAIVRATSLEDVQELYGAAAADLHEDTDIGSLMGLQSSEAGSTSLESRQRVKDHVWLYTIGVRPTRKFPKGRVLTLAGGNKKLIHVKDELPYQSPDREYRFGLTYFHWWRVTGRFWSRGLVESMEDAQRRINERATQNGKIIRRGMPKVFLQEKSLVNWPQGLPMEAVTLKANAAAPNFFEGIGPGPWMQADIEQADNDISHATGIYGPSRGENPTGVVTYSQLALIAENDQTKRKPIYVEIKRNIKTLVEDGVYDINTYWPPEKKVMVTEDDESKISSDVFQKAKLAESSYIVSVANGSAKPRSQGAMLQLVNDIWNAAIAAATPLPIDWYKRSLEAGQPLDLPDMPMSNQANVAQLENHMLLQGLPIEVAYYDNPDIHVPQHRMAQDQARATGANDIVGVIEQHIQAHLQVAQQNALEAANIGAGTLPVTPPGPDGLHPPTAGTPAPPSAPQPSPGPPSPPRSSPAKP